MVGEIKDEQGNSYEGDPDIEMATIGIELENFISKKAGKYLVDLATSTMDEGFAKLLTLDPQDDLKEFRSTMLEIKVAQQALTWIHEGIQEGLLAQDKIRDEEQG